MGEIEGGGREGGREGKGGEGVGGRGCGRRRRGKGSGRGEMGGKEIMMVIKNVVSTHAAILLSNCKSAPNYYMHLQMPSLSSSSSHTSPRSSLSLSL